MRSSKLFPISALVLLVLFSSAKGELKPTTHNGFFLNFGFGGGTADFNAEGFPTGGVTLNLRLGRALHQNLLLGLEIDSWRKNYPYGTFIQFDNWAATLTYYPTPVLFLKGGPALALTTPEKFDVYDSRSSGLGLTAGLGTELRLTPKFALIPMAQFILQDYNGFSTNYLSITLDVGWFW